MLVFVLALARHALLDQPAERARWIAIGAAGAAAWGMERLVAERLRFHDADGVLAALSLDRIGRVHYRLRCYGVALLTIVLAMLVIRSDLVMTAAPAYLGFAAAGVAVARYRVRPWHGGGMTPRQAFASLSRRPLAGLAAATLLLVVLLVVRPADAGAQLVETGVVTLGLAASLTAIDPAVVRYMAMAGHGLGTVLRRQLPAALVFLCLSPLAAGLAIGLSAGIVAALTASVLLLILTLRIQAYRLYRRRQADMLVAVLIGVVALVAVMVPFAAPVVALISLWRMSRGAARQLWMIP
ncbi:hypothetical protein ACU5AX_05300 [Sphingomonas sp. XXL09]|uniref:hypothetical protein n=1 Tax=Sphingomonas sp. XXL09 TaxID=3457787 RepID=UPI00406BAA39